MAGRFPAALALKVEASWSVEEPELPCDFGVPDLPEASTTEVKPRCVVELRDPEGDISDPVADDCELGLRGIAGRRLEVDELATNFLLPGATTFFSTLGGTTRISAPPVAVLPDDTSWPSLLASSSDPRGEMNRAVGRGPDAEGPLGFFNIEAGGGGLEDDGVCPVRGCGDGDSSSSSPSCTCVA